MLVSLASQPYFFAWVARMRVKYCGGGKSGKIRLVTLARFSYQSGMLIATPLSHDKFKLDPWICTIYAYAAAVPGEHTASKGNGPPHRHVYNVSAAEP